MSDPQPWTGAHPPLDLARLRLELDRRGLGRAWRVRYFPAVVSTNDVAASLGREGAGEGEVVIAEEQVGGRGRLGRAWTSPAGSGIWLSVLLRPPAPPPLAATLTLVAAVAVAEAIEEATGLRPGIKWPNDVLLGDRKVCGILAEVDAEPGRVRQVVLGVGVNVHQRANDFPPDLRGRATSVAAELGLDPDRTTLCATLLARLAVGYRRFLAEGFGPARVEWLARNVTIGRRVQATGPAGTVIGEAVGLDHAGSLLVRLDDGRVTTVAGGEVTLR